MTAAIDRYSAAVTREVEVLGARITNRRSRTYQDAGHDGGIFRFIVTANASLVA